MKIRRAKFSDIPQLARLVREIISSTPYYSPKARREEIKKHDLSSLRQILREPDYYYCLIAEDQKEIVGFSIGRNEAGVFWDDWLGVQKQYRRQGVAKRLLEERAKMLKKKGVHKIWSDTRTTNKESISLLQKMGHKKLGIFRNGWYKQDFFLWEKDLK